MSLLLHQLRAEQLIFWRSREAAVFIFIFPLLLFLLLGSVYEDEIDGDPAASVLLAGMLGYGVANTAFGGLAITLVLRREYAILKRIRSTPLPPALYFASVLASTLLVFAVQAVALVVLGKLLFDAEIPSRLGSLAFTLLLGAAAFAALGVALASLIRSAAHVSRARLWTNTEPNGRSGKRPESPRTWAITSAGSPMVARPAKNSRAAASPPIVSPLLVATE